MSPSLLDFLNHILYECSYIVKVSEGKTQDEILNDETLCKAIVRSLEIIGEATKKLPEEIRITHPQINWNDISGMRDVLIHNYFGIDYDIVFHTIQNDIPGLHFELQRIIEMENKRTGKQ